VLKCFVTIQLQPAGLPPLSLSHSLAPQTPFFTAANNSLPFSHFRTLHTNRSDKICSIPFRFYRSRTLAKTTGDSIRISDQTSPSDPLFEPQNHSLLPSELTPFPLSPIIAALAETNRGWAPRRPSQNGNTGRDEPSDIQPVGSGDAAVPQAGILDSALLVAEVHIGKSIALAVAIGPLDIVRQVLIASLIYKSRATGVWFLREAKRP
jgi:hypothetical protein